MLNGKWQTTFWKRQTSSLQINDIIIDGDYIVSGHTTGHSYIKHNKFMIKSDSIPLGHPKVQTHYRMLTIIICIVQ